MTFWIRPHEGEGRVRVLAQAFDEMRNDVQGALSALALEKSRYEGIVGSMADAVFTTDLDLRITRCLWQPCAGGGSARRFGVNKPAVLVVDDERRYRELLDKNLTRRGYRVLLASDGLSGVNLLELEAPDLVVLDLMLPDMDGYECAAASESTPVCPSSC